MPSVDFFFFFGNLPVRFRLVVAYFGLFVAL